MPANLRRAVMVGANDLGLQLARQFSENPFLGVRMHGFFDDRSRQRLGDIGDANLLGAMKDLASYARQNQIDLIYLSLPMTTQPRILNLLDQLADTTASVYFVPDIFVTDLIQARMDDVNGMPVVAVCDTPFTGVNGIANAGSWTMGPVAGLDSLEATAAGLAGSPVRFGATATFTPFDIAALRFGVSGAIALPLYLNFVPPRDWPRHMVLAAVGVYSVDKGIIWGDCIILVCFCWGFEFDLLFWFVFWEEEFQEFRN